MFWRNELLNSFHETENKRNQPILIRLILIPYLLIAFALIQTASTRSNWINSNSLYLSFLMNWNSSHHSSFWPSFQLAASGIRGLHSNSVWNEELSKLMKADWNLNENWMKMKWNEVWIKLKSCRKRWNEMRIEWVMKSVIEWPNKAEIDWANFNFSWIWAIN